MDPLIESRLRVVFAGTPEFAVPALNALVRRADVDIAAVYTQPDRPAGRGRRASATPIKNLAREHRLPIEQPETFSERDVIDRFRALAPDLLVVAAYGLILPGEVITVPRLGAINVHASLLPRWRGAAPIQRAILAGDTETGISIMRVVEALDAGPVWLAKRCPILPSDTAGSLHDRLATLGAECLTAAIDLLLADKVVEQPQQASLATYAAKIGPDDRKLNWDESAIVIERRVRALNPTPGATTEIAGLNLKIWGCETLDRPSDAQPGTVVGHGDAGIDIAAGEGVVRVTELQPAGKRRMGASAFVNGYGYALR
jgi:methionyl-tRNA formyltransferase